MNIKSLLIGSAAALAAVSGAQAADAIVAAEPEPLEYVRVCDAFGTGFFYIPGTETCLKFGGYIRFQTNFGRDASGTSDWDSFTRAQFEVDTRTDTELGGLKVGKFYSEWDNDLNGETDILSTNALFNSIAYTYDAGSFKATLSVDELEGVSEADNAVGITGVLGATLGPVSATLVGSYDTDYEEGAIRAILFAEVGPGTFGLAGVWASGVNGYYTESEWAVAAEYAIKATDKLTITPAAQYLSDYQLVDGIDAWTAGLTVDYKITDGLATKITANYLDVDGLDDEVTGFVRLQRSF